MFVFWSLAVNFFLKLGRWESQGEGTRQEEEEEEEEEEERASQEEEDKNKTQGKIHKYKIWMYRGILPQSVQGRRNAGSSSELIFRLTQRIK